MSASPDPDDEFGARRMGAALRKLEADLRARVGGPARDPAMAVPHTVRWSRSSVSAATGALAGAIAALRATAGAAGDAGACPGAAPTAAQADAVYLGWAHALRALQRRRRTV